MKKLLALLMVMAVLFAFTGCGKDKGNTANSVDNNNIESSTPEENKDNEKDSDEITIEDVKTAKETDASLFEYKEVDGGVSITGFNGEDEIVVIPEQIDGKKVVEIFDYAFINNMTLRGIKIADTINKIGEGAFINCMECEILICGNELKIIGSLSFNACKKLTFVELNDGLETLEMTCFAGTNITEIVIPNSVVNIHLPFTANYEKTTVIISSPGSAAEQFVNENGEEYQLEFKAK